MSYSRFASTNEYAERPIKIWQFRRILTCLYKNLFGVLPGDNPLAIRMVKKALQWFIRPRCSHKSLHVIEVEAK